MIAAVREHLQSKPDATLVPVAQNDGETYCQCGPCAVLDARVESPAETLLAFVNAVAEDIATTHPHVRIGTLASGQSAFGGSSLRCDFQNASPSSSP